jgi:hypothetical protein
VKLTKFNFRSIWEYIFTIIIKKCGVKLWAEEFLDQLSNYWLLKKDSAPWS